MCCKEATEGAAVSTQRPNRKLNLSIERNFIFLFNATLIKGFVFLLGRNVLIMILWSNLDVMSGTRQSELFNLGVVHTYPFTLPPQFMK